MRLRFPFIQLNTILFAYQRNRNIQNSCNVYKYEGIITFLEVASFFIGKYTQCHTKVAFQQRVKVHSWVKLYKTHAKCILFFQQLIKLLKFSSFAFGIGIELHEKLHSSQHTCPCATICFSHLKILFYRSCRILNRSSQLGCSVQRQ